MSKRRLVALAGSYFLSVCALLLMACATDSQTPPKSVFTETRPNSVFAADVDGDGDLDVLTSFQLDHKVAWYENTDGAGSFGAQQVISTAAYHATSVFGADIDGDGDLDALSSSVSERPKIAWYENTDGAGKFGAQQVISTAVRGANSVIAADVDGDGDLDVLSASNVDDKIAWYENTDGAGSFGEQQVISTAGRGASSVVAADADGDGDLDVLSASMDGKIAWYENTDGAGGFGEQQVISSDAGWAKSVVAADVDGDGDLDAISASEGMYPERIAWYENTDGAGSFAAERVISFLGAGSVVAADVDADDDLDLLAASFSNDRIAWYENTDGAGSFGLLNVISVADNANSVFAADVDGDGDLDALSTSQGDHKIAWYENTDGAGSFGTQRMIFAAQPVHRPFADQTPEADSAHGTSTGCLGFPQGFEGARRGVVDFNSSCVVVVHTEPRDAMATAGATSCDTPCDLDISENTKAITITKEGYGSTTVTLQRTFHVFASGSGFVFSPVSVTLTKQE